jgi:diguanylate cyclase (GGDEF)-like protein/PAS domain S-box-containing protein
VTVTLRLITDTTEVPPSAPAGAGPKLPPAAFVDLFNHTGTLLAILDDEARFVAVNPACMRVLGYPPEELVGRSLMDCVHPHDPTSAVRNAAGEHGWQEGFVELLARHRHADGSWRSLLWSGSAHGDHWYASAKDVTEWLRLEHRVGRDPLTGLHNREVFTDELTRALARHGRSNLHLGVLFIDIDSFKQINDSVGHEAGDHLLAEAARRLREAVRAGDVVGRLGGDEFAILLELLESDYEAVAVARRVLQGFVRPFELGSGGAISVSASVGLATAHDSRKPADRLIREADIAMYRAKATGRNRFAIFDTPLRVAVDRRLTVERDLRNALANHEFAVHYQPVVSLSDGKVVSCEALLRWTHREWGLISPAEFIPLAEENGLIVQIGAWVLDTALAQVATWRADGHHINVSVNISPRQLSESIATMVAAALERAAVPAEALCLEVTETAVLSDPLGAAARLAELRALGVSIAFDDFGTGYSSLRHLSQLPVDVIKLDRLFVNALNGEGPRRDRAILIAVTAAARELGVSVIAEGVEDVEQLAELQRAGCTYAQGFLFAEARPAAQTPLTAFTQIVRHGGL